MTNFLGPFTKMDQLEILACISNYMYYKVCDEIIYPLPIVIGCAVEAIDWIINSIPNLLYI